MENRITYTQTSLFKSLSFKTLYSLSINESSVLIFNKVHVKIKFLFDNRLNLNHIRQLEEIMYRCNCLACLIGLK